MPELPEAEVTRRTLTPLVLGRTIDEVVLRMPSRVRPPERPAISSPALAAEGFVAGLKGRRLEALERRGKDVVFRLDNGMALTFSFGLWSSVTLRPGLEGGQPDGCPPIKRLGFALRLSSERRPVEGDGGAGRELTWLVFADIAFATYFVAGYEPPAEPPPYDALDPRLGEALVAWPSAEAGWKPPHARAPQVKHFLMDESSVLGIGNGWADEILWQTRVHPRRALTDLDAPARRALAGGVAAVLTEAIAAGGEEGFLDALCRPGRAQRRIHHHGGEPCPRCRTPLASYRERGRETNFCPTCQPLGS